MEPFEDKSQRISSLRKGMSYVNVKEVLFDDTNIQKLVSDAVKRGKTKVCVFSIHETPRSNKFRYQDLIDSPRNNSLLKQLQNKYMAPYTVYGKSKFYGDAPKEEYYNIYISWPKKKQVCDIL